MGIISFRSNFLKLKTRNWVVRESLAAREIFHQTSFLILFIKIKLFASLQAFPCFALLHNSTKSEGTNLSNSLFKELLELKASDIITGIGHICNLPLCASLNLQNSLEVVSILSLTFMKIY